MPHNGLPHFGLTVGIGQGDWFDQWDGEPRTVSGTGLFQYDPADLRTTFRGTGSIELGDGMMKMVNRPRLYIENTGDKGWENVEVSGYAKVVNDTGANKLTGLTVGARSDHGNYKNNGCDAFGYYARIYYKTGECAVQKEYYHDGDNVKVYAPSKRRVCFPDGVVPLDTWIGVRFAVETIPGQDDTVLLGLYVDHGDGQWNLQFNFTDYQGSWPAIGPTDVLDNCAQNDGDAVLGAHTDCFFRSDGSPETEVHWKDAQVITTPSQGHSRFNSNKNIDSTAGRKGSDMKNKDP